MTYGGAPQEPQKLPGFAAPQFRQNLAGTPELGGGGGGGGGGYIPGGGGGGGGAAADARSCCARTEPYGISSWEPQARHSFQLFEVAPTRAHRTVTIQIGKNRNPAKNVSTKIKPIRHPIPPDVFDFGVSTARQRPQTTFWSKIPTGSILLLPGSPWSPRQGDRSRRGWA